MQLRISRAQDDGRNVDKGKWTTNKRRKNVKGWRRRRRRKSKSEGNDGNKE